MAQRSLSEVIYKCTKALIDISDARVRGASIKKED